MNFRVIMKFREPLSARGHRGGTSLACELICASLARVAGLMVPDYAIVSVTDDILATPLDPRVREVFQSNIGANFGTVEIDGCIDWAYPRPRLGEALGDSLEDVLTFDAATLNGDRTLEKPNLLWRGGDEVFLIDHSLALVAVLENELREGETTLLPESNVRNHVAFPTVNAQGRKFRRLLDAILERISEDDLSRLRTTIPATWERRSGDLDRIFAFLRGRYGQFADVSLDLVRIAG